MSYIKEDFQAMLDQGGIKYKYSVDDGYDSYLVRIETKKNNKKSIGIFAKDQNLIFLIPRLKATTKENLFDLLKEANEHNSTTIYGAYFVFENSLELSYRINHSLEGDKPINTEQIKDYIGAISTVIDKYSNTTKEHIKKGQPNEKE